MRLTGQTICFGSGDSAARNTMAPPWGIHPLQPAQCAGLIADVLVFTVTMSSDNFIEELYKHGLDAEWVLPRGVEMGPAQRRFRGTANGSRWPEQASNSS